MCTGWMNKCGLKPCEAPCAQKRDMNERLQLFGELAGL